MLFNAGHVITLQPLNYQATRRSFFQTEMLITSSYIIFEAILTR